MFYKYKDLIQRFIGGSFMSGALVKGEIGALASGALASGALATGALATGANLALATGATGGLASGAIGTLETIALPKGAICRASTCSLAKGATSAVAMGTTGAAALTSATLLLGVGGIFTIVGLGFAAKKRVDQNNSTKLDIMNNLQTIQEKLKEMLKNDEGKNYKSFVYNLNQSLKIVF
jgi:hypothetical protein